MSGNAGARCGSTPLCDRENPTSNVSMEGAATTMPRHPPTQIPTIFDNWLCSCGNIVSEEKTRCSSCLKWKGGKRGPLKRKQAAAAKGDGDDSDEEGGDGLEITEGDMDKVVGVAGAAPTSIEPSPPPPKKKNVDRIKYSSTERNQPSRSAADDDFNGISVQSLIKSLLKEKKMPQSNLPVKNTALVQRKIFVSHPDPRPAASCSWCGCGKNDVILCPICDMLREHGWTSYFSTCDQYFLDHNNERMRCVKNFLLASTAYVVRAMNAMTKKDRLRLLKQFESANQQHYTSASQMKGQRIDTENSARTDFDAKKKNVDRIKYSSTERNQPSRSAADDDFNGISVQSLIKSLLKEKKMLQSNLPVKNTALVQRKIFVSHPDPRPAASCSWCGCGKNDVILCPICDMLREHGWSSYFSSNDQNFLDHNNKRMRCVKNFLLASTAYVVRAMNAMTKKDRLRLLKQFESANQQHYTSASQMKGQRIDTENSARTDFDAKKKNVDRIKYSSTERNQPSRSAADDDFNGISVQSLIKSLLKEKKMLQSNLPVKNTALVQRKIFVSHPDPRPAASCSWCGCGKNDVILCPICDMLREHGWSSYFSSNDQNFLDHNNKRMRCVKNFLLASTAYVVRAMNAMTKKDRLRLLKQFESANQQHYTSASQMKGQRIDTENSARTDFDASESHKPQNLKQITIELPSISQLLLQKNGLDGVLKADVHSVYKLHFGSNANIAAKILMTLGKGDIPPEVENEVPFLRSSAAVQELSNGSTIPPSKFVGVFRVVGSESTFAVGIPVFYVDNVCFQRNEKNGVIPPKEATVNNGHICLLRVGIVDESKAGKLFSFMYRILYGTRALSNALKDSNVDSIIQDCTDDEKKEFATAKGSLDTSTA